MRLLVTLRIVANETIQTGTMGELAGVSVGSGNVWARDEVGGRISVTLSLPDDEKRVLAVGDAIELDERRCVLVKIEPLDAIGAHRLHFEVEQPATGSVDDVVAPTATTSAPPPAPMPALLRQAKRLRAASSDVLRLLGVDVEAPDGDEAWVRTDRQEYVEIDRASCGPNDETTWTWESGAETEDADPVRVEVSAEVVRWSPDEIHETRVIGYWSDGAQHASVFLVSAGGNEPAELHFSAPDSCADEVADVVRRQLRC